ncbi:MAG: YjbQ family protein [Bacteroidetes bacterium]|nr:MAG: YjbQ family protein [Bacteroidota bacterium]
MVKQIEITFPAFSKGFHRIEARILQSVGSLPESGILNLFVKHTSAAIMINENADPDVQKDLEYLLNKLAPEGDRHYIHTIEGYDDMPAHFKSATLGVSINIPISNHQLNLGVWQGIYLCEFRNHGRQRNIVATIIS